MSFSRDWASPPAPGTPKTMGQDHCTCEMNYPKTIEKDSELTGRGAERQAINTWHLPFPALIHPLRHCSLHKICPARARATRGELAQERRLRAPPIPAASFSRVCFLGAQPEIRLFRASSRLCCAAQSVLVRFLRQHISPPVLFFPGSWFGCPSLYCALVL